MCQVLFTKRRILLIQETAEFHKTSRKTSAILAMKGTLSGDFFGDLSRDRLLE